MSPAHQKVLASFRRSGYAAPLREILEDALDESRRAHVAMLASDENTAVVRAYKTALNTLFGETP